MDVFSHSFFADSDTPYDDARYVIFGVPFDGTTSFRPGTRAGPRAIRELSYNFESYVPAFDLDLAEIPFTDLGDLDVSVCPNIMVEEVVEVVREIIQDKKIPVMLGGEHSVTAAAVRAVHPDCFIVCDAHLDLREEFRGAANNHACTTRRVYEESTRDIIIIGGRSGTAEQFEFARNNLVLYTADMIRQTGIASVIEEIQEKIEGKHVYLSIDADAIDCCLTPGLGTPEPFGLLPGEIRDIVTSLAPSAVAFDYTEVCPVYDHGQAATVAGQIIREFIAANWMSRNKN
ncbi:MAG TPA: agmatinase [Methanoregulaceae archaeon]|nr:agmatinase [Methanoregulaceae archaeon]